MIAPRRTPSVVARRTSRRDTRDDGREEDTMAKLTAAERALTDQVSAERLEDCSSTSPARCACRDRPEERATFRYIARTLKGWGFEIEEHRPECWTSWPVAALLETAGRDAPSSIPCITHSMAASTPPEGVVLELRGRRPGRARDAGAAPDRRPGRPVRRSRDAGQGLPGRAGGGGGADPRLRRPDARDDHLHRLGIAHARERRPAPQDPHRLREWRGRPRASARRWAAVPCAFASAPRWTRAGAPSRFSSRISARRGETATSSS